MRTSFATTLFTAAALYGTIGLSAPAPVPADSPSQGHISSVISHADQNGNIEWTTHPDGSRTGTIPFEHVSAAESAPKLAIRGPKAAVGAWTNIGKLAAYGGHAAEYACEKSGAYGVSSTIQKVSTDACSQFLETIPGTPVAQKAWNIYQAPAAAGADGGSIVSSFRWFYNTANAPTLTETICKKAYEQLTSSFCQGKGDKGDDTRGGEISIGDGDDYLMIGVAPNDA